MLYEVITWKPAEFFREVGGNVYFLEAYDATKIPVLFVHGAAGLSAGEDPRPNSLLV